MAEEWARSGRYVFAMLFLACLFVRSMPAARPRGRDLLAAAAVIQLVLVQLRVSAYGEISGRYLVIPAALCIPWAAAAFVALVTRISWNIADPTAVRRGAVWLSGLLLALVPLAYYAARPLHEGKEHYRRAGLWLGQNAAAGDIVAAPARLEQVLFYAGRTWPHDELWIRVKSEDDARQIGRRTQRGGAAWYVDAAGIRRDEEHEADVLAELHAGEGEGGMLQPVHRERAADGEVFIWRVADSHE